MLGFSVQAFSVLRLGFEAVRALGVLGLSVLAFTVYFVGF